MKDIKKITPFITSIYITSINIDKSLVSVCNSIHETQDNFQVSNCLGFQSERFTETQWPDIIYYCEFLKKSANLIYKDMGINKECSIINYWINVSPKYAHNVSHHHMPESYFSAVLYVQTPKDCGNIIFERDDSMRKTIMFDELNEENFGEYIFSPKEGNLIIFPSHLRHYVEPNMNNEKRISISFNLK